ncbi:PIR Superfamily Protein [Plasmodium ovale wallikeri]|uniref:PIR Superfamily Protein n=1 Tax=Plasmodium ovale wallikeri TaxID=864142 RepID=A0A1A8YJ12_PLAOA|nr:PIR Superfamily Protein [Plasmodium ovale wallikeri]
MTLYATLEDLPSYKFYKQFDEGDASTYISSCKAEEKISSNEKLVELCSKILKNLKLLSETKNQDNFHNKRCNDLNYWISEQLHKNHGVKEERIINSPTYISLYTSLIYIKEKEQIYNICSIDYTDTTTEEKRRRKNLYDYYENYEKLEKIIIQKGEKCSKEHNEYLTKCVALYKETQQFCRQGETYERDKCPPFFSYSLIYCPDKDLSVMPCELEAESEASVGLVSETEMLAKEEVRRPSSSDVPVSGDISDTDSSSEPSPSLSNTLMTTSIPVLGSCFFFLILYRLTPIGLLIRNRLLKGRGKINELSDNVTGELWEDTMDHFALDSDSKEFQLAYQSF